MVTTFDVRVHHEDTTGHATVEMTGQRADILITHHVGIFKAKVFDGSTASGGEETNTGLSGLVVAHVANHVAITMQNTGELG